MEIIFRDGAFGSCARIVALVCGLFAALCVSIAWASSPPAHAEAKASLDDELMKELAPAAPIKLEVPPAKAIAPARASGKKIDSLDEALREELEGAGEDMNQNPLAKIAGEMRTVADRLADRKSDSATLAGQVRIAAGLTALVEQLRTRQQESPSPADANSKPQGSSRAKPSQSSNDQKPGTLPGANSADQPAHNSTQDLRENRSRRPDSEIARSLMKKALDRLNLPEKERERMLSAPPDELLPNYEFSTKRYFERLLEDEREK